MNKTATDVLFEWRNLSFIAKNELMPTDEESASDAELVRIVLDEIQRFSQMSFEERRAISKPPNWPLIYEVPDKQGNPITCGKRAAQALMKLADGVQAANDVLGKRCSANWVYQAYKQYFVRSVLRHARNGVIDEVEFASRYRQLVVRLLSRRIGDHVFGIPCVLPLNAGDDQGFDVGDVRFIPTKWWLDNFSVAYPNAKPLSTWFGTEIRSFPWLAVVTVRKTEPDQGRLLAEKAVDAAINIVRAFLVLSGYWPEVSRLGHVGGRLPPQKTLGLTFDSGVPCEWLARDAHPYMGDDFVDYMRAHGDWLQLLSGAVVPITQGGAMPELAKRFLDALKWFGEAALEGAGGAQIVKSVMALERLLIFAADESGGLGSRVSRRAAALAARYSQASFLQVEKKARDAYSVRSDLMHGTVGPFEDAYRVSSYDTLALAAETLLTFANLVSILPRDLKTDDGLRKAMVEMVEQQLAK